MQSDNREEIKKDTKAKPPLKAIVGIVLIFTCIYFGNAYYSKSSLLRFARNELVAKGYEVIDLKIIHYSSASKQKDATGKLVFVVKDKNGNKFDGKASISGEISWLIFNTQVFNMDEINRTK